MRNCLFFIATLSILIGCKDENPTIEQEKQEEVKELTAEQVETALIIKDAVLRDGLPPAPNPAAPEFRVLKTELLANPTAGFTIPFTVDGDFSGVYLQVEGSSRYYDIPFSSLRNERQSTDDSGNSERSKNADYYELPIAIVDVPETGEFCSYICVYDEDGNVSLVQDVCATIQNWGGSSELTGRWKLVKTDNYENGELSVSIDQDWGAVEFDCDFDSNNDDIGYSYTWLEIYANGAYTFNDLDSSFCEESENNELGNLYFFNDGFWSYDVSNGNLNLVAFGYSPNYLEGQNNYIELEEPYAYFGLTVENITATTLEMKDEFISDDANSSDPNEQFLIQHFERF